MHEGLDFPNLDPVALDLGFLAIRWYSLAYIFGILGAWFLLRKMSVFSKSVFTVLKIDDFLLWGMLGILVGGRLGYVLFYNLPYYKEYPAEIFALWKGGMSFHGGLLGVILALVLFCWKKKINLLEVGDMVACVAPIGLFLGRLANFINGELFGRVTQNVPWAIRFPAGGFLPRHPSQLYEAVMEGIVLFCLLNSIWWFSKRARKIKGLTSGLFFIFYGTFRFGLEYFREPDAHLGFVYKNFTTGQLLCVPMIIFGALLVLYSIVIFLRQKKGV